MKPFKCCMFLSLLSVVSLPLTADAMGSRHHANEAAQNSGVAVGQRANNETTRSNNGDRTDNEKRVQSVPEPSSLLLLGIGITGLALWKWRREAPIKQ
jgi:PEP-CTERM motif-containing protein